MVVSQDAAPYPQKAFELPRSSAVDRKNWSVHIVVVSALFNCILSFMNANGVTLSASAVIFSEASIYAAAIGCSFKLVDSNKRFWVTVSAGILAFGGLNAVGSGTFDPKLLRDVLVIPIFIVLGFTASRTDVIRAVVILQVVVLFVAVFEAVRPEEYGRLFNVTSYYINTRGFEESQFWSQDTSSLFVSATRPGDRFLFNSLDIHRLSSVFLEPVSLGNYCVIVAMILVALWDRFTVSQKAFMLCSEALLVIGCDGRFATVSIALVLILRFAAVYLPKYSNVVYFPVILVGSFSATSLLALSPEGDDFPSRTAGSVVAISNMSLSALMGFQTQSAYHVMDSGVAYLLYSQSLLGAVLIWGAISFGLPQRDRASIIFAHATGLYFSLNLLISYSVFSVKTAGLLWFSYGAIRHKLDDR